MKQEVIKADESVCAVTAVAGVAQIEVTGQAHLPTRFGHFEMISFRSSAGGEPHLALTFGLADDSGTPLVRIHSECITGDVFGSIKCECGDQLQLAMQEIANYGCGVLIYLRQEGRGIGIENKLKAYALQDEGYDTIESNVMLGLPVDARTYDDAAGILRYLSISSVVLLTNNPEKIAALQHLGIVVEERREIIIEACDECRSYLDVKQNKMGHLLNRSIGNEGP